MADDEDKRIAVPEAPAPTTFGRDPRPVKVVPDAPPPRQVAPDGKPFKLK